MLAATWSILRQTVYEWFEDGVPRLGAALAYYSVFSIGPLLVIAISIASVLFDTSAVQREAFAQIAKLVGEEGVRAVKALLANASIGNRTLFGTVFGIGLLLFGAIAVVVQLKDALNIIWDVEEPPADGIWSYVRKYAISFAAVLSLGFLLTVSLITTTMLSAAGNIVGGAFPDTLLTSLNFAVDLAVLTLLFAMIFKWLPDIEIAWRDVWIGAALTSLLFIAGKFAIAFYLNRQGLESTFGAASSFVLLLIWIYYSAQLVLMGAEFTQVFARRYGSLAGRESKAWGEERSGGGEATNAIGYAALAGGIGLVLGTVLRRD
ncbi:MAG: YihY/virulence factor BrkB family protein [Rhodomicrobium sp.]|nr:YihY/virulence factor BrkB family protein [Rhodomicrobium sp.]